MGTSTFRIEDWRDTSPDLLQPLYEHECERWSRLLGWDYRGALEIVESARQSGVLPGFIAVDAAGRPQGWCFYVLHDGHLQIGGLDGDGALIIRGLLDAILASPQAALARTVSCFLLPSSQSVRSAIERQHMEVREHLYLSRPLHAIPTQAGLTNDAAARLRFLPLHEVDAAALVRVLARAYDGQSEGECFAPDGRMQQWAHYLGQLLRTPACGHFVPQASFALTDDLGQCAAMVVITAISDRTVHLAQIAVDPWWRGRGLAGYLVARASHAAAAMGSDEMTLIVSGDNARARSFYRGLAFEEVTSFLWAKRGAIVCQPRRSSSEALATTGETARR